MKLKFTIIILALFPFFMFAQPVVQKTIITATDGQADDMFGYSMKISGNIGVIGMPQDDDIASNSGAVYVYERSGNTWSPKAKLTIAESELADYFGEAVDIDDNYIIVGAYQAEGITGNTGVVYIYKHNGTDWELQSKIFANDGESADNFGKAVAISGDYIIVGAPNEYMGSGAAYIFHKTIVNDDEVWVQINKIEAEDTSGTDHLGCSVDIDGDYSIIGAWQNDAPDSNSGAVYVYSNNAGTWSQHAKLVADDAITDASMGYSVAMSGNYVVAGAWNIEGAKGAAYVFYNDAGTWSQHAKLMASDGNGGDYFGKSVSMSGDLVLVGSQRHNIAKDNEGAAYLFTRSGETWSETTQFTASDASDTGIFGICTAIDGDYAFVSTVQANGAVYVFGPDNTSIEDVKNSISLYPNPANNIITFLEKNISNISIFDINGKLQKIDLLSENKVDVSELSNGMYFIELQINNTIFYGRFIKK